MDALAEAGAGAAGGDAPMPDVPAAVQLGPVPPAVTALRKRLPPRSGENAWTAPDVLLRTASVAWLPDGTEKPLTINQLATTRRRNLDHRYLLAFDQDTDGKKANFTVPDSSTMFAYATGRHHADRLCVCRR